MEGLVPTCSAERPSLPVSAIAMPSRVGRQI